MKKKDLSSVHLHTFENSIEIGVELIGKYLPTNYKDRIKEKYPKVNLKVLQKVRHKYWKPMNYLTEFNYLVELSKAQQKQLNYLEELIKL